MKPNIVYVYHNNVLSKVNLIIYDVRFSVGDFVLLQVKYFD